MRRKRIAIINQHGENRGDEAAMRAMIRGLDAGLGEHVSFDVIVQFKDRSLHIPFEQDIRVHHMVMPLHEIALMGMYAVGLALGLKKSWLLPESARGIVEAIRSADLVVSAPGGPYLGDIYASHEPLHWLYIWLAKLHRRPLFLYAPSAGPFRKPLHNMLRRKVFGMFDAISVRESRSLENLRALLGPDVLVHLTADSAIQDVIEPVSRQEYFTGPRKGLSGKFIVAVTGMQYGYPGDADPALQKACFTEAFTACLAHLAMRRDCHFVFLPQLYGKAHDDTRYHELLGRRLPAGSSWELVPAAFDSDRHRQVFGMADLCLASRYHPQIFSTTSGVPGVYACYEHKQFAYLEAVGMKDFAFDIRKLDPDLLRAKLDEAIDRREELSRMLREKTALLREASRESTRLAIELLLARAA